MILGIPNMGPRPRLLVAACRSRRISRTRAIVPGIKNLWFQFLANNRRLAKSYLFFQQWTKTNATGRERGGGMDAQTTERVYKMLLPIAEYVRPVRAKPK